jgi:hypothetical protein
MDGFAVVAERFPGEPLRGATATTMLSLGFVNWPLPLYRFTPLVRMLRVGSNDLSASVSTVPPMTIASYHRMQYFDHRLG